MKSRILILFTAMTLFAALVVPVRLTAQDNRDHHHKHHRYKLIDMGTFGGPSSYLATSNGVTSPGAVNQVLNNQGTVVGWGDTSTLDPYAPNCFNPFPSGLLSPSRVSVARRCSDRPGCSSWW
jgi:hypothetical protein